MELADKGEETLMWQQRLLEQGKRVVFKTGAQVAAHERMHVHMILQTVDFAQRLTFRTAAQVDSPHSCSFTYKHTETQRFHFQHYDATFLSHSDHLLICWRSVLGGF